MKIVAVDIGGTGVKTGLLQLNGEIMQSHDFKTPRENYALLTEQLIAHITKYYDRQFDGIAISSTGLVDPLTQEIGMSSPIYEPFGKKLVSTLYNHYHVPVSAENDGNCALLAEKWLGNGKNCQDLALIVLGTSVGGAVMLNNQLVRGKHLLAGEFGFMLFPVTSPHKKWEIWSITGATRSLVNEVACKKGIAAEKLDGHKVIKLYQAKDKSAVLAMEHFIEELAVACYNLQYILDPEKILIGGGISKAEVLLPLLQIKINELAAKIPSNVLIPKIENCAFFNQSNLLGACYDWQQKYHLD